MFHGSQINHKINWLHKSALRKVYDGYISSSQDLLIKDNSYTIHHQNIHSLATEISKTLNALLEETFEGILMRKKTILSAQNKN